MTTDDAIPDLAALVGARLCHDLISPIGAIGNGLELLQLAGHESSPELALVSDSLATALAKLRFFRIAFGPADPQAHLGRDEAVQTCETMFQGRFTVAWDVPGDLPRPLARLAFLAALCLEKSLPLGGTARLREEPAGTLVLLGEGRRIAAPSELWSHIRDGTPLGALRPDAVQFALLRQGLAESGHRIEARFGETEAEVRIAEIAAVSPIPDAARP